MKTSLFHWKECDKGGWLWCFTTPYNNDVITFWLSIFNFEFIVFSPKVQNNFFKYNPYSKYAICTFWIHFSSRMGWGLPFQAIRNIIKQKWNGKIKACSIIKYFVFQLVVVFYETLKLFCFYCLIFFKSHFLNRISTKHCKVLSGPIFKWYMLTLIMTKKITQKFHQQP